MWPFLSLRLCVIFIRTGSPACFPDGRLLWELSCSRALILRRVSRNWVPHSGRLRMVSCGVVFDGYGFFGFRLFFCSDRSVEVVWIGGIPGWLFLEVWCLGRNFRYSILLVIELHFAIDGMLAGLAFAFVDRLWHSDLFSPFADTRSFVFWKEKKFISPVRVCFLRSFFSFLSSCFYVACGWFFLVWVCRLSPFSLWGFWPMLIAFLFFSTFSSFPSVFSFCSLVCDIISLRDDISSSGIRRFIRHCF